MLSGFTRAITIVVATGFVFVIVAQIEALTGGRQGCLLFENTRGHGVVVGFSGSSFDRASPVTLGAFERKIMYDASGRPIRASEDTVVWERAGSKVTYRYALAHDHNARFVESTQELCLGYAWVKTFQ